MLSVSYCPSLFYCSTVSEDSVLKGGALRFCTTWPLTLLALAATAFADTPAQNITKPKSIGKPHICLQYFPPDAIKEKRSGIVEVIFDVTSAGTVKNLIIAASSGYRDMDIAAATCAARWQYAPGTEDGTPVDTHWNAEISFLNRNDAPPFSIQNGGHLISLELKPPVVNCLSDNRSAIERLANVTSATEIDYNLSEGQIQHLSLSQSSGDATLDALASTCVNSWHFAPAKSNDPKATGPFKAIIDWRQLKD